LLPKTVAGLAEIKEQADFWRRLGRCVIAVAAFGAAPLMVTDIAPLVPARIVMPAGLPAAAPFVMPSVLSGDRAGDDTADGKARIRPAPAAWILDRMPLTASLLDWSRC
jgi:hypothetical protein